ncbi:T9SS type A sorting domain-containing protein [Fulvivirga sedimenti]|uniref:T9SS type A sorting domain-containing protein n=1 Tax=Fulvivirga sedimenti TaxID=2879465 RepID=A0A9X1HLW8_9BACT|nr:T9SS type A sorting domain-containing protein [Fulvivirga sedimenti]MCA6073405.1 T9SS type A sorting domain-containing protein [Fulvivirga sedimenti]
MKKILLATLFIGITLTGFSQSVSLDGSDYAQGFNTLAFDWPQPRVLPNGWYLLESGAGANTDYGISNGSLAIADTYSYGAGNSIERSLGSQRSGASTFGTQWGVSFTNNTGKTITELDVSYIGEQWRLGTPFVADFLIVEYSTDASVLNDGTWTQVPALTFVNPTFFIPFVGNTLNGNDPVNQDFMQATITGLSIPDGATFWLRWTDFDIAGTDDEHALAVDQFSLSTTLVGTDTEVYMDVFTPNPVDETAGSTTLTIALNNPSATVDTQVDLALVGGSGSPADLGDFVTRTLTIPAGATTYDEIITITDDADIEGDETFIFELQNASGGSNASIVTPSQITLTVVDDDAGPLHYRSAVASGTWAAPGSWETSLDGNDPWIPALEAPDFNRGPVTIQSGNTITVASTIEIDEVTVAVGGTLTQIGGGAILLRNGPGTDLTILGTLNHNGGFAPDLTSDSPTALIATGSIININATSGGNYGTSPSVTWQNGAILDWDVNAIFPITEYFPGTPVGIVPVFRVTTISSSVGNANNLTINGRLAVRQGGTLTLAGTGTKIIRNGFSGNGTITQNAGSGQIQITGTVGYIEGNGAINLNSTNGLQINTGANIRIATDKTFNGGPITVNGTLFFGFNETTTLTISHSGPGSIGLQGTGTIIMNNAGSVGTIRIASESPTFTPTFPKGPNATIEFYGDALQNIPALDYVNLISSGTGDRVLPNGGTITVSGNFTSAANAYTTTGSTVDFIGTDQSVPGINFYNLTLSNGGTKTLAGAGSVDSYLNLDAATTFDTGGNGFTLTSSSTETASIGVLPATAVINGDITTQRYIDPVAEIYRYITAPVSNATVADIQDDVPITGTFTGADNLSGWLPDPSMFNYDESVDGDFNSGYVAYPVASNTEPLEVGRGYTLFVRDGATPAVIDFTGTINRDAIVLPVTFTQIGGNDDVNDGWNLVGNPYPSAIDWENTGWTKTRMDDAVYIRDNEAGQFASYVNGIGVNGGTGRIASGQAFWVQATGNNPALSVTEDVKSNLNDTQFFRTNGAPDNVIRLTMSNSKLSDEIALHLHDDATMGKDAGMDAVKFGGDAPKPRGDRYFEFASVSSDGYRMAINSFAQAGCSVRIPLDMKYVQNGNYTINMGGMETLTRDIRIILIDKYADKRISLDEEVIYSFTIGDDPKSVAADRFDVELNAQEMTPEITYSDGILSANYDNVTWFVNGTRIEGVSGSEIVPTVSGAYTVEVASGGCIARSEKLDVVIGDDFGAYFSVAPNPVENFMNLRVYSDQLDVLQMSVIDMRGRLFVENELQSGQDKYQINVSHLPAGVYILKIASGDRVFTQRIIKR